MATQNTQASSEAVIQLLEKALEPLDRCYSNRGEVFAVRDLIREALSLLSSGSASPERGWRPMPPVTQPEHTYDCVRHRAYRAGVDREFLPACDCKPEVTR